MLRKLCVLEARQYPILKLVREIDLIVRPEQLIWKSVALFGISENP